MKKPVLMVVVVLVLLGGVWGLAFMGIINIPGITPVKKVDWKATVLKFYQDKKGTIKGDVVSLKGASKDEMTAFSAAAKTGGLEPLVKDDTVKSAKLVAFLKKEAPPAAPQKVAEKPKPAKVDTTSAKPGPKKVVPKTDPDAGTQTVADLWNKIEVPKLLPIVKTYKDPELATILLKMDPDHVSELLSAFDDKRAAALSRELQKQGAILPVPTPA